MRKIRNVLLALMIACMMIGCGDSSPSIVGTWESSAGLGKFTFNKDGSGTEEIMGIETEISYSTEDGKLTISYQEQGIEYQSYYEYLVEGNQLKLAEAGDDASSKTYIIYDKVVENNSDASETTTTNSSLTADDLRTITEQLQSANSWAQFYGSSYVEYESEVFTEGYDDYYQIICDEVSNLDDVRAILAKSYSAKAIDEIMSSGQLIERDGKLYTSVYGIGGTGEPLYKVSASGNDDEGYSVTFHRCGYNEEDWTPNYEESSSTTYKLIVEDGKFVFDELAPLGFSYVLEDCEYVVE